MYTWKMDIEIWIQILRRFYVFGGLAPNTFDSVSVSGAAELVSMP